MMTRKVFSLLMSLLLLLSMQSTSLIAKAESTSGGGTNVIKNVALNQPVEVSSNYTDEARFSKDFLTDGDWTDNSKLGWASNLSEKIGANDPVDVTITMDKIYLISQVVVKPVKADAKPLCPRDYEIQVSMDNKKWDTVATATGKSVTASNDADVEPFIHDITPTHCKYVRVHITGYNFYNPGKGTHVASLGEIEAMGYFDESLFTVENVALNQKVEVSSNYTDEARFSKDFLTDGDWIDNGKLGWASNLSEKIGANDPVDVNITLDGTYLIKQIVVKPPKADAKPLCPRDYELQVSKDKINWDTVATVTGKSVTATNDEDVEPFVHDITPTYCKYFRLHITGYNFYNAGLDTHVASLGEIELMGYDDGSFPKQDVSINKEFLKMGPSDVEQLSLTSYAGAPISTVIWTSDDETVAKVDETGKVTAVACGSTTIHGKTSDAEFTCSVVVEVTKTALEKAIGDAENIDPKCYTQSSVDELNEVLTNAKSVFSNNSATQKQIDDATNALNKALGKLTFKDFSRENVTIKIDGKEFKEFDKDISDYRILLSEDTSIAPMVTVDVELPGTGKVTASIVQAAKIPDCALIGIQGKTYRIRFAEEGEWTEISGEEYDAFAENPNKATAEFEFSHDYSQTLTTKMFLASPNRNTGGSNVYMTFAQALEAIRQVDKLTAGVPKIVYLVGWQYTGHDDKYPSWDEVNPALKNPEHATAVESLIWLMDEAKAYNTTVSLHINSSDAYPNSPLWDSYVKNGLINEMDGKLDEYAIWSGIMSYRVNHKLSWSSGFYKERVDNLCEMLQGRLEEAGTIHSDASESFISDQSKTVEEEQAGRRQMIRYWRTKGIDFTTEHNNTSDDTINSGGNQGREYYRPKAGDKEPNLGLIPMVWNFAQTTEAFMTHPAKVLVGANDCNDESVGFIFGESMMGENLLKGNVGQGLPAGWDNEYKKQFCTQTAMFTYLNSFDREELTDGNTTAKYSDGVVAKYSTKTITKNNIPVRINNDIFVPATWEENMIIGYSENGYTDKEWKFTDDWTSPCKMVDIYENGKEGRKYLSTQAIKDGGITLSLAAGQMVLVVPNDKDEAKEELLAYRAAKDNADYDDEQIKELDKALEDGNKAIDEATTPEKMNEALEAAKKEMDSVKTKAQLTAEKLKAEKESTLKALEEYRNGKKDADYGDAQIKELDKALEKGAEAINDAANSDEVTVALKKAKDAMDKIKTKVQLEEEKEDTSANTGDRSTPIMWIICMALSAVILTFIACLKRKSRHQ